MSDDLETKQKELWRRADKHVVLWGKIQRDDYDFHSWADGSDEVLNAGCAYEYARESHRFRLLLVLSELRRERSDGTGPLLMEFERPTTWGIYLSQSGWERWLRSFAEELVSNKSFAKLYRTSRSKVEKSLKELDSYSLFPKAVQLPGRDINYPGSQIIPIRIFWRYTNKEIGAEMEKLAAKIRPAGAPEPQRRGKGKSTSTHSFLNALSVMRIYKHERNQWKRLKLVAEVCGYEACVRELMEYELRRTRGHGNQPMSNDAQVEMSKARARALNFFQRLFQWEIPSNFKASRGVKKLTAK